MIKVVAKNKVMEDKIATVIELYEELVVETRKETGCITYELYQDEKEAAVLTMIEEWVDQDALDKHMKSEHFQKVVPMVGKYVLENALNIYHKVY